MPNDPGYLPYQLVQTFEVWRSHGGPPWGTSDELYEKYYGWANETYPFAGYGGESTNVGWSAVANGPSYVGPNVVQPSYLSEIPAANVVYPAPANLGLRRRDAGKKAAPPPASGTPSAPAGGQPPASSYTGPRSGGWASQPNGQAPIAFTDAQWAGLNAPSWSPYYADHSQYMTADGVMHNSQYNYVGPTMGEANTQAAGNDQLNRYGQALGTPGPLNNRSVMGQWWRSVQRTRRPGNAPAGSTQKNPTFLTPNVTPHNSDGGGGGGGTYTGGTYNDLINWRI